MRLTNLEIAYTMETLSNLTESAEKSINDCSWIESLEDDLNSARQILKKYAKILEKEAKQQTPEAGDALFHRTLAKGFGNGTVNGQQIGELVAMYRGLK